MPSYENDSEPALFSWFDGLTISKSETERLQEFCAQLKEQQDPSGSFFVNSDRFRMELWLEYRDNTTGETVWIQFRDAVFGLPEVFWYEEFGSAFFSYKYYSESLCSTLAWAENNSSAVSELTIHYLILDENRTIRLFDSRSGSEYLEILRKYAETSDLPTETADNTVRISDMDIDRNREYYFYDRDDTIHYAGVHDHWYRYTL